MSTAKYTIYVMMCMGLLLVSPQSKSQAHDLFLQQWQEMQHEYKKICSHLSGHGYNADYNRYIHPHWQEQRRQLAAIIAGAPDANFLQRSSIAGQMVRSGWGKMQEYESRYLKKCISRNTHHMLQNFKDVRFGGSALECTELDCSSNALGQLFYMARVLELSNYKKTNSVINFETKLGIKTVIEFGGGYGCLARIHKMVSPEVTYIIFDLPEYLAIQSLFLRSTLPPEVNVQVCAQPPTEFEAGAIYLVPVFYLERTDIKADLFISTFALSESPATVQKMVADKKFFNSSLVYITGQLDGWDSCNFELHDFMMEAVRSCYPLSVCHPFQGDTVSYELFGTNFLS